jgi:pyridoxal phosphate enzyme (YggS family)
VSSLHDRLADVRGRIARAAGRANRDPSTVRLVAVSKTFPATFVRDAAAAGQADFGENKVQEGLQKIEATSDLRIRWHLIGHLQSNKARKAAERFDVIQSIDSPELLRRVDDAARAAGRLVDVLVQVDLAGEETKYGAEETALPSIFDAAAGATNARAVGLMLLPPAFDDAELVRPYFRRLNDVRRRLISLGVPSSMLVELSMGMSHDFEVAVEEGATIVRVGSAIFGDRPSHIFPPLSLAP